MERAPFALSLEFMITTNEAEVDRFIALINEGKKPAEAIEAIKAERLAAARKVAQSDPRLN